MTTAAHTTRPSNKNSSTPSGGRILAQIKMVKKQEAASELLGSILEETAQKALLETEAVRASAAARAAEVEMEREAAERRRREAIALRIAEETRRRKEAEARRRAMLAEMYGAEDIDDEEELEVADDVEHDAALAAAEAAVIEAEARARAAEERLAAEQEKLEETMAAQAEPAARSHHGKVVVGTAAGIVVAIIAAAAIVVPQLLDRDANVQPASATPTVEQVAEPVAPAADPAEAILAARHQAATSIDNAVDRGDQQLGAVDVSNKVSKKQSRKERRRARRLAKRRAARLAAKKEAEVATKTDKPKRKFDFGGNDDVFKGSGF